MSAAGRHSSATGASQQCHPVWAPAMDYAKKRLQMRAQIYPTYHRDKLAR
ncbi:unnamed protein product [Amoebophrya sp. A120]|nr:unnamed protein product [Amoebophrya sp. A120]|eukprot:GSA120T00000317001.1